MKPGLILGRVLPLALAIVIAGFSVLAQDPGGPQEADSSHSLGGRKAWPLADVTPTNDWCDFWSMGSTFNSLPLPVGTVVDAYDPQGVHCGTFTVSTAGMWGVMHVYADDPQTPADEGASPGDMISFRINGWPATVTSGDPTWVSKVLRQINIAASELVTITVTCTYTPNYTPTATPTSTPTPITTPKSCWVPLVLKGVTPTPTCTPYSDLPTPGPTLTKTATPRPNLRPVARARPLAPRPDWRLALERSVP